MYHSASDRLIFCFLLDDATVYALPWDLMLTRAGDVSHATNCPVLSTRVQYSPLFFCVGQKCFRFDLISVGDLDALVFWYHWWFTYFEFFRDS